jgi:hypothetical protein
MHNATRPGERLVEVYVLLTGTALHPRVESCTVHMAAFAFAVPVFLLLGLGRRFDDSDSMACLVDDTYAADDDQVVISLCADMAVGTAVCSVLYLRTVLFAEEY